MRGRDVHLAGRGRTPRGRHWTPPAAIALRPGSPESSSGVEVLSALENTDQMYALLNRSCSSIVVSNRFHPHLHIPAFPFYRNGYGATPPPLPFTHSIVSIHH
uniref:Uncharacterized protein n=1 Tax=Physcomitrium patens TaxID=3218 RepID=A0A2K1KWM4_PHYPA|nr:hypothetical protein PHYPA_005166 [Physcomitrium patens]